MYTKIILLVLGSITLASAQVSGPAPPASTLTSTQSGVLPVATGNISLETIEGAIVYDKNPVPGFTGPGGNATVQSANPSATYMATLPSTMFLEGTGTIIGGSIMGVANSNGTGIMFTIKFTGFPSEAEYGPLVYHIHGLPVPADGNCTKTLGHLDPTDRGEYYACDNTQPQTCQAGDLAGKHGNITGTTFSSTYMELYLSTDPSSPYYFGDKSVVIHSTNVTRLTCANFQPLIAAVTNGTTTGTGTNGTSITTPSVVVGEAGRITNSLFVITISGVAAFLIPYLF